MATYPGGKNGSGTYQQIINKIPIHNFYFEGFAGSAAIYRIIKPAANAILCDICSSQVSKLKLLENRDPIAICFDTSRNIDFIVNFLNFLSDAGRQVFAYFDPPYPFSVRSCQRNLYDFELSDQDHIALLSSLISARFNCMISTYDSPMYCSMLDGWNKYSFQSTTHRGSKTETIYFNYNPPSQLHDYSFIGNDFREREQFSRIRKNFISKLNQMPDHLKNAILSDIQSLF